MQYLIVLLLAVSASATYNYGNSYYPTSYGHHYDGYSGLGYSGLGYSGLGYGVGGYSYAPSSYYSGGAISKYIAPAVTSYAAPAVTSYAAPAVTSYAAPAVSYVKPAVSYAAAPAVSYVKPAVTYAAAPAVSYVKPAVTYAAAPTTYVAPAPRIQNPWWVDGRSHISFTLGATSKGHDGKRGTAPNLHQTKGHTSTKGGKPSDFPDFPKSGPSGVHSENPKPFNGKPGVKYVEEKPQNSNEKPSDSSFFDATKSSENDRPGFELNKPNSQDESSFDSDSFSDDGKSSESDPSDLEFNRPDSKDEPSDDSDSFSDDRKSSERDPSDFEFSRPDSKDESSFDSDSFFDDSKSSDKNPPNFEFNRPDSKDESSFDSDSFSARNPSDFVNRKPDSKDETSYDSESFSDDNKSSEKDRSGFGFNNPGSQGKPYFGSSQSDAKDEGRFKSVMAAVSGVKSTRISSRFNTAKVNVDNQKRVPSIFDAKPQLPGAQKSPSTSDQFSAGTPKIKFVMGRPTTDGFPNRRPFQTVYQPQRAFRDGPSSFHSLRDRVFYLSGAGEGPSYDFSSVYGPSTSLFYDGGDVPIFLDGAPVDFHVYKKK